MGCVNCPEKADCESRGSVKAFDGFYPELNKETGAFTMKPCLSGQCNNMACGSNRKPHAENPLCGQCLDGFSEWGGDCVECKSEGFTAFMMFIFAFLIVLAGLYLHYSAQSYSGTLKIFIYFVQTLVLLTPDIEYLSWLSVSCLNLRNILIKILRH